MKKLSIVHVVAGCSGLVYIKQNLSSCHALSLPSQVHHRMSCLLFFFITLLLFQVVNTACAVRPLSPLFRQKVALRWNQTTSLPHRRSSYCNESETSLCCSSNNDEDEQVAFQLLLSRNPCSAIKQSSVIHLAILLRGGGVIDGEEEGDDAVDDVNKDNISHGRRRRRRRRRRKRSKSLSDGVGGQSLNDDDDNFSTIKSPSWDDMSKAVGNDSSAISGIEQGNTDSAAAALSHETVGTDALVLPENYEKKLDASTKSRRRKRRVREEIGDNESSTPPALDTAGNSQVETSTTDEFDSPTNNFLTYCQSDDKMQPSSLSVSSDSASKRGKTKERKSRRRRTIASSALNDELLISESVVSSPEDCGEQHRNDPKRVAGHTDLKLNAPIGALMDVCVGKESDIRTFIASETGFDAEGGGTDKSVPAQSELNPSEKSNICDDPGDDMSTVVSISASIDIPNEELIPDSINAHIEKETMPIDPLSTVDVNVIASYNMNTIVSAHRKDVQSTEINHPKFSRDMIDETSPNENAMEQQTTSNVGIQSSNNIDSDSRSQEPFELDSANRGGRSMTHWKVDAGNDDHPPLSVPRVQSFPGGIDSSGEFEEYHLDLDIKTDSKDGDNLVVASLTQNDITSSLPATSEGEVDQNSIVDKSNVEYTPVNSAQTSGASSVHLEELDAAGNFCMDSQHYGTTETFPLKSRHADDEEENTVADSASAGGVQSFGTLNPALDSESTVSEDSGSTVEEIVDADCLTISIVTWNLGEDSPSEKEFSFVKRFRKDTDGIGSDLVMIGAQECEDIKPRRTEGRRSRHLRRMGILMLGEEYVPLAIHSLGGIQCALYCHRDVLGDVEMISLADVTCGVGNVFHNKGAIGVYLKMKRHDNEHDVTKSSRYLFVTGHLAAHVKNVDARNSDFKRIMSQLEAQAPLRFLRPKRNNDGSLAECDGTYLLSSMDHVFFAGDLNYRLDLPREYVERCIIDVQQQSSEVDAGGTEHTSCMNLLLKKLLRRDQLLQAIASGHAFSGFNEGKISFLPTFKFDKGTSNYDTSHKQRVPAWTDRIVFRSDKIRVLDYQSIAEAKHSDHRPVFGTYQLGWGLTKKLLKRPTNRMRKSSKNRVRGKKGNETCQFT